jgi:hypothetical protein
MIDPRAATVVVLFALGPVGLYFSEVGNAVAAVASTLCVLVVALSLYLVFGAESESETGTSGGGEDAHDRVGGG